MSALEYSLAGLFALAGVRSFVIWIRRGFEAADTLDHVLYALHLMARVGLWFAFAGFFAIYGSLAGSGRPLADELAAYRWYVLVPMVLAAIQLVTGIFLARRVPAAE